MTLDELIRDAKQWLQEGQTTPGGGSPFSWPGLIVQAADTICLETDCLMRAYLAARPAQGYPELPPNVRLCNRGWVVANDPAFVRTVGFWTPGEEWERRAILPSSWATEEVPPLTGTSKCPLPAHAQPLVAIKAAHLRCIQFPTTDNAPRVPMLQGEYARLVGDVETKAAQQYRQLWA